MLVSKLIYIFPVILLSLGLYIILTSYNYTRKIIGLAVFQNAVLVFYIALSKVKGGIVPISQCLGQKSQACQYIYSSPLPHVLMLTAIVVGIATMSVSLAIIHRIYNQFNSCNEDEILLKLQKDE